MITIHKHIVTSTQLPTGAQRHVCYTWQGYTGHSKTHLRLEKVDIVRVRVNTRYRTVKWPL